jgi:hypothetical protein
MPLPTAKFCISRILTATAVLVDETDPVNHTEINNAVLMRAAYLIQKIWQAQFPKMTKRYQVNDFWRRVRSQGSRSDDIFELIIVWDETINPPGCAYGENVLIQITKSLNSNLHHRIKITAKKD